MITNKRNTSNSNRKTRHWIDIYPFDKRDLDIKDDGSKLTLNSKLEKFIDENWLPQTKNNQINNWVPFVHHLSFTKDRVKVDAGAMQFREINGINKTIENGLAFAPKQGYVNCLSVGFVTATMDGYVIFQRRDNDVHLPSAIIHEPCGYMSSKVLSPQLFDLKIQLDMRKTDIAETFKISSDLVSYDSNQDFLAADWLATEMYFSTTGKIEATVSELSLPDGIEFIFVPFEDLNALILNQGELADVDRVGYKTNDVKKIPLIGESLTSLIWGYEKLTGWKLDIEETIDSLNHTGLNITVFDTNPGKSYDFPIHL